jgi:DNA-binding LacI/PurR family transcriptional regulator
MVTDLKKLSSSAQKYKSIKKYLLGEIHQGKLKEGDHILPEIELAQHFSVSRGTVQKAIIELQNDGYLARKKRSGTIVSSIKGRRSNLISLVMPFFSNHTGKDIHCSIMDGAEKALIEQGYHIVLCRMGPFYNEAIERISMLKDNLVDGIIFDPLESLQIDTDNESLVKLLGAPQIPVVLVDRRWSGEIGSSLPYVTSDNLGASCQLTKYLISLGYKRIAYLRVNANTSEQRFKGYQKALIDAGIPLRPEYQLAVASPLLETQGIQEADVLTALATPPEIIMCTFDILARNVISRLESKGIKVPKQIGVVGFDDSETARVGEPLLTTVRQNGEEIGRRAALILINKIRGGSSDEIRMNEEVPCQMILRDSVVPRNEFKGLVK